jgi:hypothetical protein
MLEPIEQLVSWLLTVHTGQLLQHSVRHAHGSDRYNTVMLSRDQSHVWKNKHDVKKGHDKWRPCSVQIHRLWAAVGNKSIFTGIFWADVCNIRYPVPKPLSCYEVCSVASTKGGEVTSFNRSSVPPPQSAELQIGFLTYIQMPPRIPTLKN